MVTYKFITHGLQKSVLIKFYMLFIRFIYSTDRIFSVQIKLNANKESNMYIILVIKYILNYSMLSIFTPRICHNVILIAKSAVSENKEGQRRSASYIACLTTSTLRRSSRRGGNFISFHDTLPLGRKSDLFFRQTVKENYDVDDK